MGKSVHTHLPLTAPHYFQNLLSYNVRHSVHLCLYIYLYLISHRNKINRLNKHFKNFFKTTTYSTYIKVLSSEKIVRL